MVGDVRHWRDQTFYAIPKQLQRQFLESLGEDTFVMQLGAFNIYQRLVSVNDSKAYGCTQSALNDHHIRIT